MIRRPKVCIRTILGLTIMVDEIVCRDCEQVFYDWWEADNHICDSPTKTQAGTPASRVTSCDSDYGRTTWTVKDLMDT